MIELLSTETKPVYIGYNKLAADVAEATTDALKWSVMSMLPNAECVEDGSIDRKACRKLSWDFKKKYSFRIGAFRRDFLD